MLEENVLCMAINNVCFSHTEEDIKIYLSAVDRAFAVIKEAVTQDSVDHLLPVGVRVDPIFKRNIK